MTLASPLDSLREPRSLAQYMNELMLERDTCYAGIAVAKGLGAFDAAMSLWNQAKACQRKIDMITDNTNVRRAS